MARKRNTAREYSATMPAEHCPSDDRAANLAHFLKANRAKP